MNFPLVCDPAAECGQTSEAGAGKAAGAGCPTDKDAQPRAEFPGSPPEGHKATLITPLELSKAEAPTPVSPTPFFQGVPHFLILFSSAGVQKPSTEMHLMTLSPLPEHTVQGAREVAGGGQPPKVPIEE